MKKDVRAIKRRGLTGLGLLAFPAFVLGLFLFFAPGCAPRVVDAGPAVSEKPLIWPGPPQPTRIRYIKSIGGPRDIGIRKGFLRRALEFILGEDFNDIIKPYGVTVDSGGRILVADTAFSRIHIFDEKGKKYSYIDEAGKGKPFVSLIGVAADSSDNIYATDSVAGKLYAFDKAGKFLFEVGAGKRPTGVAVGSALGYLYVVDSASHRVQVFDLKGSFVKAFGSWGGGDGQFNFPVDIFVDRNGDVYVTDTMNYRVQVFTGQGAFVTAFGRHGDGTGDFGRPKGLAVDSDGNVYIADALFDTVQIFSRKGEFLLNFGRIGSRPGEFWMPGGVFIDASDTVCVADPYNKRVQVYEYMGDSETVGQ